MVWRILIVDDQHDNLTLAGAVFGLRGAVVELVDNATTALSLIQTFKPTVILVDIAMPEMDGWELLHAIRASEANKAIPVIALTVRVSIDDQRKALAAGFDGYIAKPYSINGIIEQVEEVLASSPSHHA
jgi:two-component system cell cycle response regulator DivK